MKITVINATEKRGVTYKPKEVFLEEFRGDAEITEFYPPKDCPEFCTGCTTCFLRDEHQCKDAEAVQRIEKALIGADVLWSRIPEKKRAAMAAKLKHVANELRAVDYSRPAATSLKTRAKFYMVRQMQKSLGKEDPEYTDFKYWKENGWIEKERPW